jgi:hypothetical protein
VPANAARQTCELYRSRGDRWKRFHDAGALRKGSLKPQISPLRCASVEMTKAREGASSERSGQTEAFSATTVDEGIALPFVISTEAQRSGEICGFSGPSLEMFFLHSAHYGRQRLKRSSLAPAGYFCGVQS